MSQPAAETVATLPTTDLASDEAWQGADAVVAAEAGRGVQIRALNHIVVRVTDLAKAEAFYADFWNMELIGRARRTPNGTFEPLNGNYRWDEAVRTGTEADVTLMRNGALTLALQNAGRGARLNRVCVVDVIAVGVDATTFTKLKGDVLMRGFETISTTPTSFVFRDPFGVAWEATIQGTPEFDF